MSRHKQRWHESTDLSESCTESMKLVNQNQKVN